jgi:hypothetical protein
MGQAPNLETIDKSGKMRIIRCIYIKEHVAGQVKSYDYRRQRGT